MNPRPPELSNRLAVEDVSPAPDQTELESAAGRSTSTNSKPVSGAAGAEESSTLDDPIVETELQPVAQISGPSRADAGLALPGGAIPGAALPGGDEDDDEDFEIPGEVEYGDIVRADAASPVTHEWEESSAPGVVAGIVAGLRADGVFVDIGRKSEAFLPIAQRDKDTEPLKVGDKIQVTISGTSSEGSLLLQSLKAQRPKGWTQLEEAFASGGNVVGKVSEVVRGGLAVDIGVRAFLPGSRSGERTDEGLQALVGNEIRARIVQLDEDDRNVVIDRRIVLEEERANRRLETLAGLKPGDTVPGIVRNMRKFGAFVDLGGVDGLLHVSDMAWRRVSDPADILREGQQIDVKVLEIGEDGKRISVGLKQLQPDPWTLIAEKIRPGDIIRGPVTRLKDFGAFVEVEPGIDGLVHVSEMAWNRRVRHPSEVVKVGDVVEVAVLDLKIAEKRIALGLKQALGDPWERVEKEYPVGTATTGTVRKIASFGAFVEIFEGMDGLLHISDITSERRLNNPGEVLREGRKVRVKVLEIDREKRRLKLGMKQLEPTEKESFMSEVQVGDRIAGRIVEVRKNEAIVEISEGVTGTCPLKAKAGSGQDRSGAATDLSSMTSMLEAAWKGGDGARKNASEPLTVGSVHTFTITKLGAAQGLIELTQA